MMARKCKSYWLTCSEADRFNGAAPMMARKSSTGKTVAFAGRSLQWGRANDGAEILPCVYRTKKGDKLQWGRANDGAEICCAPAIKPNRHMLQWGRANDGAEMSIKKSIGRKHGKLQWGRANDGAEIPA